MSKLLSEEQLKHIANQLGRPEGEDGILIAERMAHTNNNMTKQAISALDPGEGELILEIGPGNGTHVKDLILTAPSVRYYGVDISETMVAGANHINKTDIEKGNISFALTDANQLNFKEGFFDKIFTVNTLYFWEHPVAYASEILRVLKAGGLFCLAIATREFMEQLPFTKYKFKLYDGPAVETLLKAAGFSMVEMSFQKDLTTSHTGEAVERDIIIVTARKG